MSIGRAFKWSREETKAELAKVHLSNLPENLAFFSGAIDAAGSFGGIYQSAVYAYGSELIKDPVDPERFLDLQASAGAREVRALQGPEDRDRADPHRRRGGRSRPTRCSARTSGSSSSRTPRCSIMSKPRTSKNLEAIKKLLQVSPGSTMLLRGHVDNALVDEFRKQGGEAYVRTEALRAMELSKNRAAEIRRLLVEKHGVDGRARRIVGRGWEEPAGPRLGTEPARRGAVVHDRVACDAALGREGRSDRCAGDTEEVAVEGRLDVEIVVRLLNGAMGRPRDGMTRREMLQDSLAAAAGLLLSDRFAIGAQRRQARGRRRRRASAVWRPRTSCRSAGYDVTVVEARNRVGGRVISFTDLVPGKIVEGGGELIGSNHPTWVAYASRSSSLKFLDVTEEDFEFPIVLGGKRLTADEAEALWEEMEAAFNTMNADAARVTDAERAVDDARRRGARPPHARVVDQTLDASPLCKAGIDAMMTADNGVQTEWQSYLGNLAMVKGGGLEKFWTDSEVYRCTGGNQQLASVSHSAIGDARAPADAGRSITVREAERR